MQLKTYSKIAGVASALFLMVFLAACSSTPTPTYTPSGANGYLVTCDNVLSGGSLEKCVLLAGQTCGNNGYKVIRSGISSMLIECKQPGDGLADVLESK